MNKLWKYNNYLYMASRILVGIDILRKTYTNINELLLYFSIFILILINDHLRINYLYKDIRKYFCSIFITMIASGILIFNLRGYTDIFMFIIIYELIIFTEGRTSTIFTILEMVFIISIFIFRSTTMEEVLSINFWKANIIDILMSYVSILFYAFVLFSYKTLRKEKRKTDKLNNELELSYKKLQEQSEKLEELAISKERNRLAGEIHDNLGHNLVALNMNLDVADKIIDTDLNTVKVLIKKSLALSKSSIEDLRKAVYALKEESPRTLRDSIEKLISNIKSNDKIKVLVDMDIEAEDIPPEYKEIIYKAIKESLTNSIKHGNANLIYIDIKINESDLIVRIKDNGTGCKQLVKGNGLLGIEERVTIFGGRVDYRFNDTFGFETNLKLFIQP